MIRTLLATTHPVRRADGLRRRLSIQGHRPTPRLATHQVGTLKRRLTMMKPNITALTLAGVLSVSSMAVFAQSSNSTPPVNKGGMPPSTEIQAGSNSDASGNALPPGSVEGGNGGDASGSSTSPGTGGGSTSGGSTMGSPGAGASVNGGSGASDSGSGGSSGGGSGSGSGGSGGSGQ
jgi:hypothetical protein